MNERFLKVIYKICSVIVTLVLIPVVFSFLFYGLEKKIFYPEKYNEEITEYSDKYGINKNLVYAVIKTESNFNKNSVSDKGAMGLMQITEKTGKFIAEKLSVEEYDLLNIKINVEFGCFYLRYLLNKFSDERTAICAYNAGEGNVSFWLIQDDYSEDGKTLKEIPFKETNDYVNKVYKNFKKYQKLYGDILDKS